MIAQPPDKEEEGSSRQRDPWSEGLASGTPEYIPALQVLPQVLRWERKGEASVRGRRRVRPTQARDTVDKEVA